ncbi:class I adenylate-forming enzyme family protein [Gordonia shandongensis]|uniref:class I adenylate-forming enzyme family protein n=1 Tax=Gordonia shandongensis TaxID=376351 RepID=UPI0012EC9FAE|nr:AMP-binding protein [Gordonia shandongensis]
MTAAPTLTRRLAALATDRGESPAVTDGTQSVGFSDLRERADAVASGLAGAGVRAGDRVVMLARNRVELFEVLFGCARIGAVFTAMNWRLTEADLRELIADSGARVAFVESAFAGAVPAGVDRVEFGAGYDSWRSAGADRRDDRGDGGAAADDSDAVVLQFYTSGTTGRPKGVEISHDNLAYLVRAGERWQLGPDRVAAAAMPFFHMGGSAWGLVTILLGGTCRVIDDFDPEAYLAVVETERVTNALLAPTMLQMLLDAPSVEARDLSSLTSIAYGSAPITPALLARIREVFAVPLLQLYGLTETCGGIVQLDDDDHRGELLTSVGRPYPWVEVTIADPEGNPVDVAETGEIWVRSPQCSRGYWRNPEATADLIGADGWLRTGDAGSVTAEGYLFVTDRIKDMVITGGENVYPSEVERVLAEHPDVADLAVFGVSDAVWGEAVTAAVVLRPGGDVDGPELIEWMRPRIAGYMRPKTVHVMDDLPRNPAGKILKRDLRAVVEAGSDGAGR